MPPRTAAEKAKAKKAKEKARAHNGIAAGDDIGKKPAGYRSKGSAESAISKLDRLQAVMHNLNAKAKRTVVEDATGVSTSYILRRPTGITSLDIALAGGFPASAPSVIVGPDGAGKDFLLWTIAAEVQKIYGENFAMAVYFTEFLPDKVYMKDKCGFQIGMSDEELDEMDEARDQAGTDKLTAEERAHYKKQIGKFIIIAGVTAEDGLDAIIDFVASNSCQMVAVNSIGFFQTDAKEEQETFSDFAQRSSEAILISKFMPKLAMILNQGVGGAERNETTVFLVNQVRAADQAPRAAPGRQVQEKDKYKAASAAWALKHGKAIELFIHNGGKIYDEQSKQYLGRNKSWEISKGKLGTHEGIRGDFEYFYETGVDLAGDLMNCCKALGVFRLDGTWMSYKDDEYDIKGQNAKMTQILLDDPVLYAKLRDACLRAAGIVYRYR